MVVWSQRSASVDCDIVLGQRNLFTRSKTYWGVIDSSTCSHVTTTATIIVVEEDLRQHNIRAARGASERDLRSFFESGGLFETDISILERCDTAFRCT